MAPADRHRGKGGSRRARPSSIRAAAETAAGSTAPPTRAPRRGASKPARAPRSTKSKRSRSTRGAAPAPPPGAPTPGRMAIEPEMPEVPELPEPTSPEGGGTFPDYEVRSDSWDPWGTTDGDGPGRRDPDFDAQRTLGEWLEGVIPPDAQIHFANAGREFAQGVQVTVDHHTGRRGGRDGGPGGPSRIEIE